MIYVYIIATFIFSISLFLPASDIYAQDPIPHGYGAGIATGLAPLEEKQAISWVEYIKNLFIIPVAQAQTPDLLTGLIGHWKFDETSGTTATDSSGNNNTGTLVNWPSATCAPFTSMLYMRHAYSNRGDNS
jgi:hypothetical protein